MSYSLKSEDAGTLKEIVDVIIGYQSEDRYRRLAAQLPRYKIDRNASTKTKVVFYIDHKRLLGDVEYNLDVEAQLRSVSGNLLHAIVYIDENNSLSSLEIFPWEGGIDQPDVSTIVPVRFGPDGVSIMKK